ncbi:hypothetical protein HDU81_006427 [Chytriomyces hyalinus]|nr:hypothetical protein HDU81_006427 [Chytriomyces hyalinus]
MPRTGIIATISGMDLDTYDPVNVFNFEFIEAAAAIKKERKRKAQEAELENMCKHPSPAERGAFIHHIHSSQDIQSQILATQQQQCESPSVHSEDSFSTASASNGAIGMLKFYELSHQK